VPLGFSQGGAMAMQLLRRNPHSFPGVVALSALLVPGSEAGDDDLRANPRPVFWGHADTDPVISLFSDTLTPTWLHQHTDVTEKIYPCMGHSVSAAELADLRSWLFTLT